MPRKNHALPAKMIEILNHRLADAITETMMQLPAVSFPEVDAEAIARWLDDGGASDNQAASDARVFSPPPFFRP